MFGVVCGLCHLMNSAVFLSRVTNLSEDATDADLRELFRPFGIISRLYLCKDRQTGKSRGFAFVNFSRRLEAEEAIRRLNGHGYDNLILCVEWAPPRKEKDNNSAAKPFY